MAGWPKGPPSALLSLPVTACHCLHLPASAWLPAWLGLAWPSLSAMVCPDCPTCPWSKQQGPRRPDIRRVWCEKAQSAASSHRQRERQKERQRERERQRGKTKGTNQPTNQPTNGTKKEQPGPKRNKQTKNNHSTRINLMIGAYFGILLFLLALEEHI